MQKTGIGSFLIDAHEALHWGAMTIKKSWTSLDACRCCLFAVMTAEELAELRNDPCETCDSDLCNWKGRS